MAKIRRSPSDYEPEAMRFEEWLLLNEGKTMNQIQDVDELILSVENWLESIDIYGHTQGSFARSLLTYLLERNIILTKRPKEVEIVRDFLIDRSGRRWLTSEEKHLKRLWRNPKVTSGYISRELGRTKTALYSKASKLGVQRPKGALTERDVKKRQGVGVAS
jgi:hypothetical protein